MKHSRFYQTVVAIAMMLMGWLPSLAHDFEVDGICYNILSDNSVEVTYNGSSYNNDYEDVIIPETVTHDGSTYSVTGIGYRAFAFCTSLTSLEIPNSVTSIGESAFSFCTSLSSLTVEAGNTKYDSREECNAIIETASNSLIVGCGNSKIPNSVTSIGNRAFYDCASLTSIEIPNSVTKIGE